MLRVEQIRRQASVLLRLSGPIRVGRGAAQLRQAVIQLFEQPGIRTVYLDLDGLGVIDSAALGEIIALHRRATISGQRLVLINSNPRVTDLLSMTRLDSVFEIYADLSETVFAKDELPVSRRVPSIVEGASAFAQRENAIPKPR